MSTETTTHGPQHVRARITDAITAEYLRRVAEEVSVTPQEHCDALASAVLIALRTIAAEMEQQYWGGSCPQCAAYLANLAALVQERVGKHACPLCAEYLALKERAESSEAEERPLVDLASRTEPTMRERIAAALFEQQLRKPWAMAYPCDSLNYLADADVVLGIRDSAMTELRQQAERAESVILQAFTGLTGAGLARGFRLVQRDGRALDGAAFPSGRAFVLDDSEYGFGTAAASVADLLRGGYHGATVEWESGALPTWEAMYEPGNVSDYVIGYGNSEAAAKGAAEAWLRSERGDTPGRLEWVPNPVMAVREHDQYLELVEHHTELGECATGINVRHRALPEATG